MLKIAIVYTGITKELVRLVETEVKVAISEECQIVSYSDPTIIAEAREHGFVTTQAGARLVALFIQAIQEDADIILNACSSVGELVDSVQPLARYLGVPIVRVDEEMCRVAAVKADRIGVIGTLATTMEPTKQTILRVGREVGAHPKLIDGLIDGAFDLDEEGLKQAILEKALTIKNEVDCIVFCQGSMAYCADYVQESTGIEVLASPKDGALALKEKLQHFGKLEEKHVNEYK